MWKGERIAQAQGFVRTSSNGDFCVWECTQNVSKSFQTCGVVHIFLNLRRHDIVTWQAQYCALRCGIAIFVAGAMNHEVTKYGGGHISWQAQYFVRVGGVDVQIFVAGAGVRWRVVVGECRCAIGIGT